MKTVILKGLLLLTPLMVLMGFFITDDPMKVVWSYDSPVTPGVLMNDRLFKTRVLLKHQQNYNAFIFGSSRSNAFRTSAWKKFLPTDAKPFHLGVNDETLFGLAKKLAFLDRQGYRVNHALILLDERVLTLDKNQSAHIFREHYRVSGETALEFYKTFLMAFLKPSFLKTYVNYRLGRYGIKENDVLLWDPGFSYVPETGDIIYGRFDSLLAADSVYYYHVLKRSAFYSRDYVSGYEPQRMLSEAGVALLRDAATILRSHDTDYRIVLTPNYSQKAQNKQDLEALRQVFGPDRVWDFSGVNEWTNHVGNFYEERHFKPYIANTVMDSIYSR